MKNKLINFIAAMGIPVSGITTQGAGCTGICGSCTLDLPDRPSDLAQRDGRGVRAGNEIAKLYADNKVDVIIIAVWDILMRWL